MSEDITEALSKQMNEELEPTIEEFETDTARLRRILNGPYDLRHCLHDMSHDLNNTLTCMVGYADLAGSNPNKVKEYSTLLIREAERAAAFVCAYSSKSGSQRFTAVMSHNLNNLLTNIMGFTHLYGRNLMEREKYFEILTDQVDAVAKLVSKIQDFAYASRTKESYPVAIAYALERILNKTSDEARAKIKIKYDGGLLFTKADSKDLMRVYSNLLQNALEAGSQKINITAYAQNGTILTQISDDGKGISEKDFKTLFEPFFSTQNDVGHLGLGLATSKAIVEKYGGRILVESHPREGSIFTVELPAYKDKDS